MRPDSGAERPYGAIQATAWFGRLFDETLCLASEARTYVLYQEWIDRRTMTPVDRVRVSCETLRVTTRLAEVMAWILVQRAVHAGEVTVEEAAQPEHRLTRAMVCFDTEAMEDPAMPTALRGLLTRSLALYLRITRLDDRIGWGGDAPNSKPTLH